jgi:hypothetical protein
LPFSRGALSVLSAAAVLSLTGVSRSLDGKELRWTPVASGVHGVPAKQIRERFNPRTAAQLSAFAWWDWPAETIWQRLPEFQSGNVEAFCARWENKEQVQTGISR